MTLSIGVNSGIAFFKHCGLLIPRKQEKKVDKCEAFGLHMEGKIRISDCWSSDVLTHT